MDTEKNLKAQSIAIAQIAHTILGLKTLDTQDSDALDFHELSIWQIQTALNAAFEAGYKNAKAT